MSKAEERALEFYPMKDYNKEPNYIHFCDSKMLDEVYREVFMLGYELAEKDLAMSYPLPEDTVLFQKGVEEGRRLEKDDLALTWQDMALLRTLFDATDANQSMGALTVQPMTREYYEYLLREFNEQRKK